MFTRSEIIHKDILDGSYVGGKEEFIFCCRPISKKVEG